MKGLGRRLKVFVAAILAVTVVAAAQPKAVVEADDETLIKGRLQNAVVLYIGSPTAFVDNNKTFIDPSNQEVSPIVKNERTLVPVRFISENLGAKVDWDENSKTVSLNLKEKTVKLTLGKNKMSIDEKEVSLDAPAELISERTFVPLRALAEAFDKKVFYQRNLIIISDKNNIFDVNSEQNLIEKVISKVNDLPTVVSEEQLKKMLMKRQQEVYIEGDVVFKSGGMFNQTLDSIGNSSNAVKQSAPQMKSKEESQDYSSTNVQVAGVDEADIIKNDGQFIYQVNRQKVMVIKAYPASEMKIMSTIDFKDKNFNPTELYLDDKNLVVIGSTYLNHYEQGPQIQSKTSLMPPRYPYYRTQNMVKAIVYDINDKSNIKQLREVEVEGNYISSRKIGTSLYLVSNKNINYYYIKNNQQELTPIYRDTKLAQKYQSIKCTVISYFPNYETSNYMIVAGVDLAKDDTVKVSTYLGAGENIYASTENMYVAVTQYQYQPYGIVGDIMPRNDNKKTIVYKFGLKDGVVSYKSKGEVPGSILNQFSMDEQNDYLRIATTVGEVWRGNSDSKNNLYVLDKDLNISGKIENIAPGEKIYSARFIGDRGYIVTFKKVDPLFVIDLKDPKNPKILGKLKIPGFSDYLHPYDENHIIGFGKDTIEAKEGNFAWYQGMKIAIFDVTDVNNPVEMFKENIGDRGTESELLNNHKALLFSKEKGLLAFPVTVMEIKNKKPNYPDGMPQYGEFSYQGAYVYNIDLLKGFQLKGRITHLTDEEYLKAGSYWANPERTVERIIYIKDTLYTLSKGMVKANNMSDLKEQKLLRIE